MRLLGPFVLSCLVPTLAFANAGVTVLDDEPTSRVATAAPSTRAAAAADPRAPSDTGQLREARVATPEPVDIDDGPSATREHDVAPPHEVGATATNSELVAELAARQLERETKRHRRAIDGCLAAAHKRAPAAAGTLTLDFDVADRKLKSVRPSADGVHDPELAACLVTTAHSFAFSLAAAHFRWPVALR